ncbi:TPA: hypothetical protein DIV55_05925 [Patescibacteria group bacterium]|uniref:Uncharacterized protein n=1 Tax=Candidatus Gottesmanbacteria bacterium GW2011_GWA1_43_11 TaxID=1618436 RepID=A0A0G1ER80_9BACT|nr:MAG: hypothetical protein UV59_C0006G0022 [Candidatus Gottesmanbacteria bacterium GW2011_GWA1_43_11]HCS79246.1 hypothetical protein [Patescibacteria group bacterium]
MNRDIERTAQVWDTVKFTDENYAFVYPVEFLSFDKKISGLITQTFVGQYVLRIPIKAEGPTKESSKNY